MVSMKIMKLLVASGTAEACDNKTHEAPEESMRDQASSAGENVCGPYSEFLGSGSSTVKFSSVMARKSFEDRPHAACQVCSSAILVCGFDVSAHAEP